MPRGSSTEDNSRARRTPAEIAQDALDKADARLAKATEKRDQAKADVEKYEAEVSRAEKFREYAASNPDLPQQESTDESGVIEEPVGVGNGVNA